MTPLRPTTPGLARQRQGLGALLLILSLVVLLLVAITSQHFIQIQVSNPRLSETETNKPDGTCRPSETARGAAHWANGLGTLSGRGSLVLQRCQTGTWILHIKATPLQGIWPQMLVSAGSRQVFGAYILGSQILQLPVKVGDLLVLTAPNTQVVLEDRNLYIKRFSFVPNLPCLQNPPALSGANIGTASPSGFSLLSNGALLFTACGRGKASFRMSGSESAEVGPATEVRVGDQTVFSGLIAAAHPQDIHVPLEQGQTLQVIFSNDSARQTGARLVEVTSTVFIPAPL